MLKFSVIMSIYKSDVPEYLHIALESLLNQTRRPDEIVIVGDGPVSAELEKVVQSFKSKVARSKSKVSKTAKDASSIQESSTRRYEYFKLEVEGLSEAKKAITDGNESEKFQEGSEVLNSNGFDTKMPEITYLRQKENRGLGAALAVAVEAAQYPYLARMDADDIAVPDRFEKQLRFLEQHPDVAAVGGMIEDFSSDPNHVTGRRVVPLESEDIHRYMRSRNGMNHVTVMFKKEELLRVGNYQPFHLNEDYYLWVRMIQQGCQLMNIPDVLVRVRAEKEQVDRRGGFPYFRDQYRVFKYMLNTGFISWPRFLLNICERGTVQLLMPLSVRCWFYQRFLRK